MCNNLTYLTLIYNISLANEHTSVLFLFGEEENTNTDIKTKIKEEQARHGDIIQINGFMEHYNNLTLKTLYTLKLFLKTGKMRLSKQIRYETQLRWCSIILMLFDIPTT